MKGITVAVGAVIENDKGQVLLVKHRPEREGIWKGKWICLGGKLETGESISDGIHREVREETCLDIRLTQPLIPFERIIKEDGETRLHVIYIDYRAKLSGGELRPGSDVGEALWLSRAELPRVWGDLHEDTQRLLRIANIV